jgi:osmotically-inducible protein OsmY
MLGVGFRVIRHGNSDAAARRAAVAGALATLCLLGCATAAPESPEQVEADETIARSVYAALEADRIHLYIGLDVHVRAGVAYVSALTFDPSVRDAATETASRVPGVTKVVNEIEVSAGAAH